jgi:hypothetical protein
VTSYAAAVKNLRQRILLGLVGVAVLVVLVVFGKKQNNRAGQPAEVPSADSRIFAVDEWLDSCLKSCRATAPRRLAHLTPEKRERYCTVNCECGMEKMTEPASAPRTVRAPSKYWLSLNEDEQFKAAGDCQKRATTQTQ